MIVCTVDPVSHGIRSDLLVLARSGPDFRSLDVEKSIGKNRSKSGVTSPSTVNFVPINRREKHYDI